MAKFYRLRVPIYGDLLQIVQWPEGLAMPPHADNAPTPMVPSTRWPIAISAA